MHVTKRNELSSASAADLNGIIGQLQSVGPRAAAVHPSLRVQFVQTPSALSLPGLRGVPVSLACTTPVTRGTKAHESRKHAREANLVSRLCSRARSYGWLAPPVRATPAIARTAQAQRPMMASCLQRIANNCCTKRIFRHMFRQPPRWHPPTTWT